jgi:hypothetical protein
VDFEISLLIDILACVAIVIIIAIMRPFLLVPLVVSRLVGASHKPGRGNSGDFNITSIFEPCLSAGAEIYYPSDPLYPQEVLPRASTYDPPSFIATILPATVQDIQNIVRPSLSFSPLLWNLLPRSYRKLGESTD